MGVVSDYRFRAWFHGCVKVEGRVGLSGFYFASGVGGDGRSGVVSVGRGVSSLSGGGLGPPVLWAWGESEESCGLYWVVSLL